MQQILLLHGAIGSKEQLRTLGESLSSSFTVHSMNFSGHGGSGDLPGRFSIESFADSVVAFLEHKNIRQANIFGYSMGGYVALYLARHHPGRVNRVITLATKFHWDKATAEKEIKMLSAEKIEEKIPAFAEALKERHSPNDWKQVLQKTINMLAEMGEHNPLQPKDYSDIQTPALLILGDRDRMITPEETLVIYRALPNASLSIIPNTPHPIESTDVTRLAFEISSFLDN